MPITLEKCFFNTEQYIKISDEYQIKIGSGNETNCSMETVRYRNRQWKFLYSAIEYAVNFTVVLCLESLLLSLIGNQLTNIRLIHMGEMYHWVTSYNDILTRS